MLGSPVNGGEPDVLKRAGTARWWPGAHSKSPWLALFYAAFAAAVKVGGVIWDRGLKRVCNDEVTALEQELERELKDNNTRET